MSTKKDYNQEVNTLLSVGILSRPNHNITKVRRIKKVIKFILLLIAISAIVSLLIFHVASAFQSKPNKEYTQVITNCTDKQLITKVKSKSSDASKLETISKCYQKRIEMNLWQK